MDDEPKHVGQNVNIKQIDDAYANNDVMDDEYGGGGDMGGYDLTEEEKQSGEQFWALDELFNILDLHGTGELDPGAFKQIINDDSDKQEFITYKHLYNTYNLQI